MKSPDPPEKVLIIQLRRIGDVLLSTPVIRAIKTAFPKVYLAFLTEIEAESILTNNSHLNELILWNSKEYSQPNYLITILRELRKRKFDTVIDLQGSARTALASLLSGARQRIGFDYRARKIFYNFVVARDSSPKYGSLFKLDILKPFGIESADCKPEMSITPSAKNWQQEFFQRHNLKKDDFEIVISPVSRRPYKRWPLERFAQLCTWLTQEFKAKAVILWGPGEKEFADKVAKLTQGEVLVSEKTKSLQEVAALLKTCDLLIGNDTGIKHLATALGTPTFTIFGPSDPVSWTYPDPLHHQYVKGNCHCAGNQKNLCRGPTCLESISVAQVQKLLKPFVEDIISRQTSPKLAQA
jgi:ADP-heptose:LPS heptosyltransferase